MAVGIVCVIVLSFLSFADGATNSCQDIDHDACVAMATQNAALCSDPILASSACPSYCNNCPITCYNCNVSTSDVTSCNTMTCKDNMICMIEEVHSVRNGQHIYYLGCATKATCDGERKRALQSRDVNIHCCTNDLCNDPAPSTTALTSTTLRTTSQTTTQTTPLFTSTITVTTPLIIKPYPPVWTTMCTRDIIFMVDQSYTFEAAEYTALRTGLAQLVSLMNTGVGVDETKVALLTFDAAVYRHWSLDSGYSMSALLNAIRTISPTENHFRNTTSWYAAAHVLSFSSQLVSGYRAWVPDVVIFITGRDSSYQSNAFLKTTSSYLHLKYNNVITIGIGQYVQPYLSVLATDNHHSVYLSHATGLQSNDIQMKILNLICS